MGRLRPWERKRDITRFSVNGTGVQFIASMKIGVIVAMQAEYELICEWLENKVERKVGGISFLEGQTGGKSVVLMRSGIGKVCSAVGAVEMIRVFQPDVLINTGVAGGIDASLNVMDIVVGQRMVYHDVWCGEGNAYGQVQGMPAYFRADQHMHRVAMSLETDVCLKDGLICSGDRFITDRKSLERIKSDFPEGLAVDMESCSIAQVCYMYDVPFLSFRVISDIPGAAKHAEQYRNFWVTAPRKSFQVFRQLLAKL